MKRLIFLLMLFVPLSLGAQRTFIYDSIPCPAGLDTTIYRMFYDIENWGLNFDYGELDDVDGLLDLGGVDVADGTVFDRLDDLRLPFTLADSTVSFEKSNFSFRYLAIKFTLNSCTCAGSGDWPIKFRITKR